MPWASKKPCTYPGCRALAIGKYCDKHANTDKDKKTAHDKRRLSSSKRGYGTKWRKYRLRFLAEHPMCVHCILHGRVVIATVVDHMVPHRGDMVKFWDTGNHQALCKRCHDVKTAKQDGAFGNK